MATMRYLVNNVDTSVQFFTQNFGFELIQQFGPAMAIVSKNDLSLWLAGPMSSAAQPMPNGAKPAPGGWNRIVIEVTDLAALVEQLKSKNVSFRNDIVKGPGGSQILCEDPSGNVLELFQPA